MFGKSSYLYIMTEKQITNKLRAFGETLKKERAKKRMSITEAAKAIGTSHQNLNNMEAGKSFNIVNAFRVCSYYGLTIDIIKKAVN